MNIIDTPIGDLSEKRKYHDNENRTKALPAEYADAYKKITITSLALVTCSIVFI